MRTEPDRSSRRQRAATSSPPPRKLGARLQSGAGRLAALLLLVVLLPFFAIVILGIWLVDRGRALFSHERIGAGGRPIQLLKFRTMAADADPYMIKPEGSDPVITRIGRILRPRALDELPQLWNIVRGKMALVGPRPEMGFIVEREYGPVERIRLRTRPGLTGLWQLSRVRDRAIHHHLEYDLFYVFNKSPGLDLWLLWRTLLFAVFGTPTKIRLAVQRWERDPSWRVYLPERARAIPRRTGPRLITVWGVVLGALLLTGVVPAMAAGLRARSQLKAGRAHLISAQSFVGNLDTDRAEKALNSAGDAFQRAEYQLASWTTIVGRTIPGVRQNLRAVEDIAASGGDIVDAGRSGLRALTAMPREGGRIRPPIRGGAVDLAALKGATSPLIDTNERLGVAASRLRSIGGRLLLPPVRDARRQALAALGETRRRTDVAAAAGFLLPQMMGSERPRRWLIAAENTAELRGRGGYLGSFAVVTANGGRLSFDRFLAASSLPPIEIDPESESVPREYRNHYAELAALLAWQNLGMSPHFPSGASLLVSQLPKAGLGVVDGVISMDPTALAYLLGATGPVRIPSIEEPLTASNVADWALNRVYFSFSEDQARRREVLGEVAGVVWSRLASGAGFDPKKVTDAFGRALRERHLVLYSTDPAEQRLIERLGVGGLVERARGDYLLVLAQNLGENKMDYYLRRKVRYEASLGRDGSLTSQVAVSITNTADPRALLPGHVGGRRERIGLAAGVARSYVSVLAPPASSLTEVLVDGKKRKNFDDRPELGKRLFAVDLEVPAGDVREVVYRYRQRSVLVGGVYRLRVQNQATIRPDELEIEVSLPPGTGVGVREGFIERSETAVVWEGPLRAQIALAAQVERPFLDRLLTGLGSVLRRPLLGFRDGD